MVSLPSRDISEQTDLATISKYIVEQIRSRATGSDIDHQDVHRGSAPKQTFFSGCLSPGDEDYEFEDSDIYSRVSPSAISMFIKISPDNRDAKFSIQPHFSVFARILPPFSAETASDDDGFYRKYDVRVSPVEISVPDSPDDLAAVKQMLADQEEIINEHISEEIDSICSDMRSDPLGYRDSEAAEALIERKQNGEIDTKQEYQQQASKLAGEILVPDLEPIVVIEPRELDEDGIKLRISLENHSPDNHDDYQNIDNIDNGIYDASLEVTPTQSVSFEPFEFTRLPDDYRFDTEMDGYGVNCAVTTSEDETGLRTTCLPSHQQDRYVHKEPDNKAAEPRFIDLRERPLDVLEALLKEMKRYDEYVWNDQIESLEADGESAEVAKKHREQFQQEIHKLQRGINTLENDQRALRAFRLMNKTFDKKVLNPETGEREYDSWRLFQIVFIVSNITDILARVDPEIDSVELDEVSLIWFPTGGGKTEAYLGLMIFNMFFDRIRGKNIGLTSMMRYPLRLLSLQQFQRITELFIYADEIRKGEGLGGDEFSVGYLTGGTENKMRDVIENEFGLSSLPYDEQDQNRKKVQTLADRWEEGELRNTDPEQFRVLSRCPRCDGDVSLQVDSENILINHVCQSDSCDWSRLPVYVVDNEIYRRLPTLVVGTQDKLAALGYERKFRLLLGRVEASCPAHGYTDGTACTEKYFCSQSKNKHIKISPEDPVPGLQIQDELHLIKEELGTFESHYWSAMEKIIEWGDERQPKVIAATATIEEFENQIRHLYCRPGTLFPAPGPTHRESFYAGEDSNEIQRQFLGVTPWNRSHINSVISIIKTHQKVIQDIERSPQDFLEEFDLETIDSPEELLEKLRFYQSSVNYVISKKEGDRIHQSTTTQINPDLQSEGYDKIDQIRVTGDSTFSDVSTMLDQFEQLADDPSIRHDVADNVIATSAISHGVDLDALNFMQFFGMPRRTAEYIQSSSRVGRKYPGIVVDTFHPIRERDRSHYHYFDKYHQYLDRLVEPVPVNRKAKFSVERTLPGLFMSLILQHYYSEISNQYGSPYMTKSIVKAHNDGFITKEKLVDLLLEIYEDWNGQVVFEEVINDRVEMFLTAIDNNRRRFVSNSLPDDSRPMFSLRDVDIPVNIFADREEGRIIGNLTANHGGES